MQKLSLHICLLDKAEGVKELKGRALDTKIIHDNKNGKHEYILLDVISNDATDCVREVAVKLDDISSITALENNPYFQLVDFVNGTKI
jgi:hypothetical protein